MYLSVLRGRWCCVLLVGGLLAAAGQAKAEPPEGFRKIFDGTSLNGWHAVPRISPPPVKPKAIQSAAAVEFLDTQRRVSGKWEVRDGEIHGGQDGPRLRNPFRQEDDWGFGGWLMTDAEFGDYELMVDARPDWPCDTGIYVRTTGDGVGFQVLLDHRGDDKLGVGGGIGFLYCKGIGNFRVDPHNFRWQVGADGAPKSVTLEPGKDGVTRTEYSCTSDDFRRAWRMNDWNTFRIRVVGSLPRITTWINDVKICECDTAAIQWPGYQPDEVRRKLGGRGHIALEVHDGPPNRWGVGKVSRWRNIYVKDL